MDVQGTLRGLVPDFAKTVAPLYKLLEWQWGCYDGQPHVPDEKEIASTLDELITDLSLDNDGRGSVGTGGLEVFSVPPSPADSCWNIGIRFRIEHMFIVGDGGSSVFKSAER